MKLTKGKISKLYNKKKQSLKKAKKRKLSHKRRTFRNKRKVNLARKTLKRFNYKKYKGGAISEEIPKEENITTSNVEENQLNNLPAEESVTNLHTEEPVSEMPTEEPVTDLNTENPVSEVPTEEPVSKLSPNITPEEPINSVPFNESESEMANEYGLDETTAIEEPVTESSTEEPITELPTEEPISEEHIAEEPVVEEPNKQELIKSLTQVVDYITDTVAKKVSENVGTSSDYPQDGFGAVNTAASTMAMSGGSRFKKTRHFRLLNKNKTRRYI